METLKREGIEGEKWVDNDGEIDKDKKKFDENETMPRSSVEFKFVLGLILMAFGLYNLLNLFGIVHNVELYLGIYMKLGENMGRTLIAISSLLILGFGYMLYQGDI